MTQSEHLWAIGYDDMWRAEQVRDEIIKLGWDTHYLNLLDVAVVVRHPDGSFTCNREPFPAVANTLGCAAVGFLAGLVLLAPLTGAAVGALLGGAGTAAVVAAVGIGDDFVREVEGLMQARDMSSVGPGQRRRYGGDTACDTGAGRDSIKDQRGLATSTVDSVDPSRCFGRH